MKRRLAGHCYGLPRGRVTRPKIGDIHGASVALKTLIEAIDPQPEDTIVVLGDTIDCGPDSRGVLDQLIALSSRCHLVALLGNHEEMLLNALDSRSEFNYWFKLGGEQSLRSYSSAIRPGPEVIPRELQNFSRMFCRERAGLRRFLLLRSTTRTERGTTP